MHLTVCSRPAGWCVTYILNLSLSQSVVPTSFKMATIVLVPKKAKVIELNAYYLEALTSVVMKCFERRIKDHITCHPRPTSICLLPQ